MSVVWNQVQASYLEKRKYNYLLTEAQAEESINNVGKKQQENSSCVSTKQQKKPHRQRGTEYH